MAYSNYGVGRNQLNKALNEELDGINTSIQNINTNMTTVINNYINKDTSNYKSKVLTKDDDDFPLTREYRRTEDNTVAILATNSNPDDNGWYQTLNLKFYKKDGTTLDKTIEYHFTYLESGLIDTNDGGVLL